jgi:hypothetical protein
MIKNLRSCFLLSCTLLTFSISGCGGAAGVLAVAAGGVATSEVLDKLDDKVTHIIQQAAAAGSLLSTKAARDLELEILAARQQLHDELNQNWDKLDQEKVSGLKALDKAVDDLNQNIQKLGTMEDDLSLDVDQKLNAIPFLKKAVTIRRVEGSSQYFRTEGLYVVKVKGNVFDQMAGKPIVKLGDETRDPSSVKTLDPNSVQLLPPYDLVINIPAALLKDMKAFQDRTLSYIPITISQKINNRDYAFQLWRDKLRDASYKFSLELFPKYPAAYRLTEFDMEPFVDTNQTLVAPARFMYVSGCGNSGCNAYYNVCTDVPAGAQPIQAVDFQDSFNGWGGFGKQWATSTGICAVYWQHSHNVGRNVGFNVQYHPAGSHVVPHDISLVALSSDDLDTSNAKDKESKQPANALLNSITTVPSSPVPVRMVIATVFGNFEFHIPKVEPTPASIPTTQVTPVQQLVVDHGAVRLGRTYAAQFSPNMVYYELVFRTFTGDELVDSTAKHSKLVDASPLINQSNFKRMTVALKTPW